MFKESLSFATSAIAATAVTKIGVGALGLVMVATPIGWVGLIVGGVVIAGTAAVTSIAINNEMKSRSDGIYSTIMKRLDALWL